MIVHHTLPNKHVLPFLFENSSLVTLAKEFDLTALAVKLDGPRIPGKLLSAYS